MDRGTLRLCTTEMMFVLEVPGKVAIQESVRLAEHYGSNDSPALRQRRFGRRLPATRDPDRPGD